MLLHLVETTLQRKLLLKLRQKLIAYVSLTASLLLPLLQIRLAALLLTALLLLLNNQTETLLRPVGARKNAVP